MATSNGRPDDQLHRKSLSPSPLPSSSFSMPRKSRTKKVPIPEGFTVGPPEGGFGWVVLSGILLVTIMMSVPGTAFSIMFQDILVSMDASTSMTSWGPAISMAASNFISPLVTVAIHATSCRKAAIFGGIVLSLGLILSFFAQNIGALIGVFGVFTGIGYGFCRIACLVLASHYFHDRYGIAASVIFTGFGLGRFIFSPLVQISNEGYGVRGTFLLMGGLALNICAGASLFQPARWHYVLRPILVEDGHSDQHQHQQQRKTKDGQERQSSVEMVEYNGVDSSKDGYESRKTSLAYKEYPEDDNAIVQLMNYRRSSSSSSQATAAVAMATVSDKMTTVGNGASKQNGSSKETVELPEAKRLLRDDEVKNGGSGNSSSSNNVIRSREARATGVSSGNSSWRDKLLGSLDFTLLKESVFYVVLGSQVLTYLSLMYGSVFFPTLCRDKGLSKMEAAILPTFRAAAEIFGRVAIPFLQSISKMDPIVFYIITCIVASLAFMAQALVEGYYLILLTGLCTGCLTGGTVVQNTTITLISVGKKKLPSTLGLCAFFQGFFILVGGPLIGRVRDVTGSLVYGYLLITAFQLACAFVWIFRYISVRNSKGTQKCTPAT